MATVRIALGGAQIEVEGGVKEVFKAVSEFEVLSQSSCGACGGKVVPRHRIAKGYDFYSLRCVGSGCGAELSLGQLKDSGGLFPKRRDEEGNSLPHGGWVKWEPQQNQPAEPAQTYTEPF